MAEEKKSKSKRSSSSSRSKRTKDDANTDVTSKDTKNIAEEKRNESAVTSEVNGEKKLKKSKKRRLDDEAQDGESAPLTGEKDKAEDGESQRRSKKKRVSFSVEAQVKSPSPSPVEGDEEAEADDEDADAVARKKKEEKKRKKMEKKERNKEKQANGSATIESTKTGPKDGESPVLFYLDQYHNDRSVWKFQKIREIQLFKHILSLEHIPPAYEPALLAYLQGLRGDSAKQRLREVAQTAIKADVEETKETNVEPAVKLSDDQAPSPTMNYRKAIYAFRTKLTESGWTEDLGEALEQLDDEMLKRFQKRRRAEVIFFAVDGRVFTMSNLKAPPQQKKNAKQDQAANKKKKNRTAVVDFSSSSDSDSDSEDDKKKKKKNSPAKAQPENIQSTQKKKKNRTAIVEISSSSESSSSESSSDSESDSSSSSS